MTIDQKKDKILNVTDFQSRPFSSLYKKAVDRDEQDDEGVIFPLMDEMIYDGLIKISDGTDAKGEFVTLTTKGKKIKDAGGFLKVKFDLMTEGQKVHKLLEFMAKTGEYHWSPESLMPAFDNLLNDREIEYLCIILIDNGDVNDNRSKSGFAIGFNEKSKSIFYGKKYLKERPTHEIKIDVGQIQNIKDSIINAPVNQSRDDFSFNKTYANTINPPTPAEIKQKPNTWTLSNISFNLVIGLIITVVGGIVVLIYWEKIRHFFE